MATLDLFRPGGFALVVLLAFRVGGLLLVAPVFASRTVPMAIRVALLLILTMLLVPAGFARAEAEPQVTAATLLGETLVGFAIGVGAALLVGAAEVAGDYLALQTGLASSSLLDPMNQVPVPTLGQFAQLFVVALFLALNGHILMLEALAASLDRLPVGGPIDMRGGIVEVIGLGGELFTLGLRFAAPVVVAVMVGNLAIGILSRAAPQFNVLIVAFPVQIGIGLFVLAAALPIIATFVAGWPGAYEAVVSNLLTAFVRVGGP